MTVFTIILTQTGKNEQIIQNLYLINFDKSHMYIPVNREHKTLIFIVLKMHACRCYNEFPIEAKYNHF